ncbi:MAG: tetratricopeptide repeat protein [Bacteroidota bacterium]|nr:tetratricopeptide repeat protein [Bacteroidota bacterium]
MMKKIVLLIYLISSSLLFSQSENEENFNKGVDLYNKGSYNEAIIKFKEIIEKGDHSENLYFNLGNAYYKVNDIANSILYFEKALKLNPRNKDVLNNLAFSQNMLVDKIEKVPTNQVSVFLNYISQTLNVNQWLALGIILLYLFLITFILYFFSSKSVLKRNYFSAFSILFLLSLMFILVGLNKFEKQKSYLEAIIFENKIDFRTEPNYRSEILFNLHEGTKVVIIEELNDWALVEIDDGNKGWIELQSIKKID